MQLDDMDDFRTPRRRPWLLLLIVAVAALLVWRHQRAPRSEEDAASDPVESSTPLEAGRDEAPESAQPLTADAESLLADARRFDAAGELLEARKRYLAVLDQGVQGRVRRDTEEALGRINIELIMTVRPMPGKVDVIVKRGDSLERIARRHGTTIDLIQKANRIENPNLIKAGDHLRVTTGAFALQASRRHNDLLVSMDGKFFKRYRIGTGLHGKTPLGQFKITEKIKEPVWWRPDGREIPFGHKENILGTHWMTLRAQDGTPDVRGYGIHGTWDDPSIGTAASAGCLRMHNRDVEELFTYVPIGTVVTIVE